MKMAFVHKYKWSHQEKRKLYRRLLKNGEVKILKRNKDGWLYGHINNNRVNGSPIFLGDTHMKLTIEIETTDKKSVAEAAAIVALLGGTAKAAPAAKAAKGKAAKAAEETAEEEFNFEETEAEVETEVDADDFTIDDDEPTGPTVEDVLKAFSAYQKKHSKEKAIAVLKKLKVKSARDIDPKMFEKVIAQLKK